MCGVPVCGPDSKEDTQDADCFVKHLLSNIETFEWTLASQRLTDSVTARTKRVREEKALAKKEATKKRKKASKDKG